VVPVFNEESSIRPFLARILAVLNTINRRYEVIFCLDPSTDETENVISDEAAKNSNVKLLTFSRRFGQPAATMAGLAYSSGDVCVVIDVDLQDPPELIESMLLKLEEGYEVVYAQRRSRDGETLFKKAVSWAGYALINKVSDVNIPRNTGDFRIMTRRVLNEILNLNEGHGFLRGLVAYVGFKQSFIEYERDARYSGRGKYNRYIGSLKIGLNGLISFSSRPLSLMALAGFFLAGVSFLIGAFYLLQKLLGYDLSPGLPTTVLAITFFAGVQLLGLGLMGEYIGRIYDEVKRRPMYIVDRKVNLGSDVEQ
jgi:dolichol-phosphate mannosyltransferase